MHTRISTEELFYLALDQELMTKLSTPSPLSESRFALTGVFQWSISNYRISQYLIRAEKNQSRCCAPCADLQIFAASQELNLRSNPLLRIGFVHLVGDDPTTSTVSRWRSSAELKMRTYLRKIRITRILRDLNPQFYLWGIMCLPISRSIAILSHQILSFTVWVKNELCF